MGEVKKRFWSAIFGRRPTSGEKCMAMVEKGEALYHRPVVHPEEPQISGSGPEFTEHFRHPEGPEASASLPDFSEHPRRIKWVQPNIYLIKEATRFRLRLAYISHEQLEAEMWPEDSKFNRNRLHPDHFVGRLPPQLKKDKKFSCCCFGPCLTEADCENLAVGEDII
ncbi:uncharacterized protein LOC111637268 [Centruroides sculpturatus]|uniref:uncharacterized protein LOC111637268 n=1 Tax=Centruroides sculpturatus TaxID=218467 RepID=UPI000C6EB688|nr:uncharacterized protein LOC111637268 [Centruroides sculpturatus]XP_023238494.1 uncharacterized protein LOC111637268 [Centruroides sculpturatus]XP_023238495.1 uncharacterized protein LOC111637268 [Centruroides sculpturatus]